jgi:exodeoxyribonuclease VII large subunit
MLTFNAFLKEPLKDGVKILMLAHIEYHPEFGLSLRIIDIDPSYTLGDLEREKREGTIEKLHAEGIISRNKELSLQSYPNGLLLFLWKPAKATLIF